MLQNGVSNFGVILLSVILTEVIHYMINKGYNFYTTLTKAQSNMAMVLTAVSIIIIILTHVFAFGLTMGATES